MGLLSMRLLVQISMLTLLTACGGGGSTDGNSAASTMTVMIGGGGTATYTEGPINNLGYYDPSFSGDNAAGQGTLITMCSGVNGPDPCNVLINIRTSDMIPGGYTIAGGTNTTTYFMYMTQGQYYDSLVSKGTITLTSVGGVGEPITGSFQAVLGLRSSGTTTIGISGTFSVIRDH